MFQQFYGFTRLPFSKSIPTDDLFNTAGQNELSARLTYLVREQGLGLITGEFGSGKSTGGIWINRATLIGTRNGSFPPHMGDGTWFPPYVSNSLQKGAKNRFRRVQHALSSWAQCPVGSTYLVGFPRTYEYRLKLCGFPGSGTTVSLKYLPNPRIKFFSQVPASA